MGCSCAQAGAAANRAASRANAVMRLRIMGLIGCEALSLGPALVLLSSNIFVMVAISLRLVHRGGALTLEEILQSLTIRKIRARAVNVPLAKPHPTAGGNVVSAPL